MPGPAHRQDGASLILPPPPGYRHACALLDGLPGQGAVAVTATRWSPPDGPLRLAMLRMDAGGPWKMIARLGLDDGPWLAPTPGASALSPDGETAVVPLWSDGASGRIAVLGRGEARCIPFVPDLPPGPVLPMPNGGLLAAAGISHAPDDPAPRVPALFLAHPADGDTWREVAEPGFGSAWNVGISAMTCRGGRVYCATVNPAQGFELWTADTDQPLPWSWHQILERGAHRYAFNPSVATMRVIGGTLWLGTAGPASPDLQVGQEGAELIAVDPADRWNLVVGAPRTSPDGLIMPRGASGPGFGEPDRSAIVALAEASDAHQVLACCQKTTPDGRHTGEAVIWRTDDEGRTWAPLAIAPPFLGPIVGLTDCGEALWAGGAPDIDGTEEPVIVPLPT